MNISLNRKRIRKCNNKVGPFLSLLWDLLILAIIPLTILSIVFYNNRFNDNAIKQRVVDNYQTYYASDDSKYKQNHIYINVLLNEKTENQSLKQQMVVI